MSFEQQLAFYQAKLNYELDAWDVFVALSEQQNIVVVDGRSKEAFLKEHIPGAINIPHRTINEASLATLDKAPLYVAYCDGIGCNASTQTAMKMLTLGFKVKELIGGLDWWKRDGFATNGEKNQSGKTVECGCDG